jgi:hypothetical protein
MASTEASSLFCFQAALTRRSFALGQRHENRKTNRMLQRLGVRGGARNATVPISRARG